MTILIIIATIIMPYLISSVKNNIGGFKKVWCIVVSYNDFMESTMFGVWQWSRLEMAQLKKRASDCRDAYHNM